MAAPRTMSELLDEGLAQHQAGNLDAAWACYQNILAQDQHHADALHLSATLALQTGDAQTALEYAERTVQQAPTFADAHANLGNALSALGQFSQAIDALARAIELAPEAAHFHFNLGNVLLTTANHNAAKGAFERAVELHPNFAEAYSNLSVTLSALALFEDAECASRRALEIAPTFANAHYNLGNALREQNRFPDAIVSYKNALVHAPGHGDAHCNLGLSYMALGDAQMAARHLSAASIETHIHSLAQFYLGVVFAKSGQHDDARNAFALLDNTGPATIARLESWQYIAEHKDASTQIIEDGFALLAYAFKSAQNDGLVLEFGVRHGHSIRYLASLTKNTVHGFDSFEGLPESWDTEPAGVYATSGRLPDVPSNVSLHKGWFEDTLADFLNTHEGAIKFANIDCDIYASTVTILNQIAPRIQSGSVLVFDEYLMNPTWRDDEFKAFQEAVRQFGWQYRYLAFGTVSKQAAVMIEQVDG